MGSTEDWEDVVAVEVLAEEPDVVDAVVGMLEDEAVREEANCGREDMGGVDDPLEATDCRVLGSGIEGRGPVGGGWLAEGEYPIDGRDGLGRVAMLLLMLLMPVLLENASREK